MIPKCVLAQSCLKPRDPEYNWKSTCC